MRDPPAYSLIRQWSDRFAKAPLAKAVVAGLRGRADEIWQHAFQLLQRESREYRNGVDDEFAKESKAHCNELLHMIIAVACGEMRRSAHHPFDFVRAHAQWRARHHVPLVASLHAYRIAHRTYSEISQDALGQHGTPKDIVGAQRVLSEFWIEFFDHVGHVLADAHAAEDALTVARETRSYVRLMNDLLRGVQPAELELQRLCALRGIRPGAPLAVVVARPLRLDGDHVDREVSLRSLARLLEQALSPTIFGTLIDVNDSQVTAIACSDDDTSRNLVQALRRAGFARRATNGRPAGIGISMDIAEVARLPEALEEAQIAIEFATAKQPLMRFSDIHLPDLLVRRADQIAVRLIPAWARQLNSAKDRQSRDLIRTTRVFADCNFNVKQTARELGVHTNTVYFRLNRVKKISSVDPRTYAGASAILMALRVLEIHTDDGAPALQRHGGPADAR
jgi:PucR C-terminal helix-turn-helix domain/GGDEF-like domain